MDDDELIQTLESLNLKSTKIEKGRFGESYFTDESTGGKYIIPSKRPDGTYRKEIKIRPGYVPPEERQLYVPIHRRSQTNQDCTPDNNLKFDESGDKLNNKDLNITEVKKEHKTSSVGSKQAVISGLKNNIKPAKQSKYNSRNKKPPPNNNSKPKDEKTTSETNKNDKEV